MKKTKRYGHFYFFILFFFLGGGGWEVLGQGIERSEAFVKFQK